MLVKANIKWIEFKSYLILVMQVFLSIWVSIALIAFLLSLFNGYIFKVYIMIGNTKYTWITAGLLWLVVYPLLSLIVGFLLWLLSYKVFNIITSKKKLNLVLNVEKE